MEQTYSPEQKMQRAKAKLLINHRFFGSLCMYFPVIEDKMCPTMGTDGKRIFWNRDFL